MSDGFPSMTALLGLIAVAGYQNRDKIAAMLGGKPAPAGGAPASTPSAGQSPNAGGMLGHFAGMDAGGFLGGGLGQLINQFTQAGHGDTAQSWVNHGPNQPIAPQQLEQALGPDVLAQLTQKTGMSRADLLARLSQELPTAVNQYTPDGRLPT